MNAVKTVVLAAALAAGAAARAEVTAVGAGGFVVRHEAVYAGTGDAAWRRLLEPAAWWDPEHTYSHDARNLTLEARPGGCFCERLADGGFVRHLDVTYLAPGRLLRLAGGLGPLQRMGVAGALTFSLAAADPGHTRIVLEYAVSGFAPAGFAELAAAVDRVLGEQLARLAAGN